MNQFMAFTLYHMMTSRRYKDTMYMSPLVQGVMRLVIYNTKWHNEEAFPSRNTQKKNFLSPQGELNPSPSRYRFDALTNELQETRGEQGRFLGSYMCDMCPAILHIYTVVSKVIHVYQVLTCATCVLPYCMLSLAVWQDTNCHTYKNLVYDLAHHGSAIAQWLERPTSIWKIMGAQQILFLSIST